MKTGLVLEGGALRGLYTMGIVDVLIEKHIFFDGMIGVSAGAAFGCNYKSQQSGRVLRYNQRFAHDWRFCSVRSWLCTGDLFGADFGYHQVPEELDPFDFKAFNAHPTAFWLVATDVETGKAVYKQITKRMHMDEVCEWIRASSSMPLVSQYVEIYGQKLLDGGLADSIPLKFFNEQGYERNIVILTQPRSYTKQPNRLMPLMRMIYHRQPRFVETIARRHDMYNEQLRYVAEQEKMGKAFVIAPEAKLPIQHITHDPKRMQRTYDMGRQQALALLSQIKAFLGNETTR
ncbi:patatin family protein [Prevotella sp. HJM029]|uniref:patatin-like phospholipase family protein n=1 Tax=Prevotella sp. HJM029 TaxID=1433844 RepID=UPI00048E5062|nr:patatin family protein [Prevotella sp. HJM029]